MHEERRFAPSEEMAAGAVATADLYEQASADRLAFWAAQARDLVSWSTDFTDTLDWSEAPFAKWFVGGKAERRLQLRGPARGERPG